MRHSETIGTTQRSMRLQRSAKDSPSKPWPWQIFACLSDSPSLARPKKTIECKDVHSLCDLGLEQSILVVACVFLALVKSCEVKCDKKLFCQVRSIQATPYHHLPGRQDHGTKETGLVMLTHCRVESLPTIQR